MKRASCKNRESEKAKLKFDAVIVTLIVMLLVIVVILVIESPKPEKSGQVGPGFRGTYVLGQQENDDVEYYVIMDSHEGSVYGFYTHDTDTIELKYRKTNENCLALLDEEQNIIATMVEAEGAFYLIKNGKEAAELTKLSDVPTVKAAEE